MIITSGGSVQLDRAGREFAWFPAKAADDADPLLFTFRHTAGVTEPAPSAWSATGPEGEPPPGGFNRWARILVAGPDATDNPDGTPVLAIGRNYPRAHLAANPEVVIRPAEAEILVE